MFIFSAEEAQLRVKQWKKYQNESKKKTSNEIIRSVVPGYEIEYVEINVSYVMFFLYIFSFKYMFFFNLPNFFFR